MLEENDPRLLIDPELKDRLDHVYSTLQFGKIALNELFALETDGLNDDEMSMINSHTFRFYRVTLQYCFVLEYCKLFEYGTRLKGEAISSLFQFNKEFNIKHGKSFPTIYKENKAIIKGIIDSELYKKIYQLRVKRIAHSDKNSLNVPFHVSGLSTQELQIADHQLKSVLQIINNCYSVFGIELSNHTLGKGQTRNFIKFQTKYKVDALERRRSGTKMLPTDPETGI